MKFAVSAAVLVFVFGSMPPSHADSSWAKRLLTTIKNVEADVEKLDGLSADRTATIDGRIRALDKRVAALEVARKIKVDHVTLGKPGTLSDMSTRSAAIVQISGRVRRIKKHDNPPPVTAPEKSPATVEEPTPKPKEVTPVEWPDQIEIEATASLDYVHLGTWLYGSTVRSRYLSNEYLHTGYEGNLHFSARLSGLERQVKTVEFVIIVTGRTGPFALDAPRKYEITWKASRQRMGNGSVKSWPMYDQWNQTYSGGWIRGPRHKNVKPRVKAYLTRVVTDEGLVVEFTLPKTYR